MQLTPYFKLLEIRKGGSLFFVIRVQFENGQTGRYSVLRKRTIFDETALVVLDRLEIGQHYRGHVSKGVINDLQRNKYINEGVKFWTL